MHQESRLGLRQNWQQFSLLVIINAFVGAMVGLERSIIPEYAEMQFGLDSKTAILSFIAAFGLAKAFSNYYAGKLADRRGRKNLLVWGWWFALPVPLLLLYAPSWNWVVFANILLGINQGLCWSSTEVMKIDLVGSEDRVLAMGLNEFAGYLAVGLMAALSGYLAKRYSIIRYSFCIGFQ
jgi:Arabinose efflux permease